MRKKLSRTWLAALALLAWAPTMAAFAEEAVPLEMVTIPAREFAMGSEQGQAAEKPEHTIWVDEFQIGKYEVSVEQYRQFIEATGRAEPQRWETQLLHPDWPVVFVSWNDAAAFCAWVGGRLPTEAEWEKAARGGLEGQPYPWGREAPDDRANWGHERPYGYIGEAFKDYLDPVDSHDPNGYGLHHIVGNVWEWCSDYYSLYYYQESPEQDPQGPESGTMRIVRGGSWGDPADNLTVYAQGRCPAEYAFGNLGFRVVK